MKSNDATIAVKVELQLEQRVLRDYERAAKQVGFALADVMSYVLTDWMNALGPDCLPKRWERVQLNLKRSLDLTEQAA